MTYQGIDTAARISAAQAEKIKAQGISFVGRYLVPDSYGKALTANEARILRDHGLGVLLIWETYENRAKSGASAGRTDGASAAKLADEICVGNDCAIYFAVDYDAPKSDYKAIEQYLYAAKAACAPYRCGVYGKVDLINSVKADCYMQCVAWSNGALSSKANVYQYEWQGGADAKALAKKVGVAVDLDSCQDLNTAGIWMPTVEQHWYDSAMQWAESNRLMNDGRPNDYVTRAELATVLKRAYESK